MTRPPQSDASASGSSPGTPKAIALVGWADSGKTSLICRLLPCFQERGMRVAVLKHSHKSGVLLGDEDKDTGRYRRAGATAVALAAPGLLQVTRTFPGEPPLEAALALLAADADLILVEGYKYGLLPKVAVLGPQAQAPDYPHVIALVSEAPVASSLPVFHPDQVEALSAFLYDYLRGS